MRDQVDILIIDDNEDDCELYERVLKSYKANDLIVHIVHDGEGAIYAMRQQRYDCILLDYNLPDVTGLNILNIAQQEDKNYFPAIILITGSDDLSLVEKSITLGASDYINKSNLTELNLIQVIRGAILRSELLKTSMEQKALLEQKVQVIDSAPDAFVTCNKEGVIVEFNKGAECIYGYSRKKAIGENFSTLLIPKEYRAEFEMIKMKALDRNEAVEHYETMRIHANNSLIAISESICPIKNSQGEIVEFTSISRDITEKKRVSKQLKTASENILAKNRELEDTNSYLQDFSHTVAHDLRNPLNAINSYLGILMNHEEGDFGVSKNEILQRCVNSTNRMFTLIDDLINFATKTKHSNEVQEIDLNETLENVLMDLEDKILESKAEISIGTLPSINGNSTQIYQVFLNLINNAIKFSKKGGVPVISVTSDLIERQKNDHKKEEGLSKAKLCRIYVNDNGIGIPEDKLRKVFLAFNKIHKKGEYEGSGIGLATVKRIVSFHCGNIIAKEKKEAGACFVITLPINLTKLGTEFIRKELRMICRDKKILKTKVYQSTNSDFKFQVIDESDSGMQCQSTGENTLESGDVLEFSNHKYEVRWVKQDHEVTSFGLKLLG